MARIIGVEIPDRKKIGFALRYIYGIGPKISEEILEASGVDPNLRARELDEQQLAKITQTIQKGQYIIEGDLRRDIAMNLKRLQAIKCYRGWRHIRSLPATGQRTSTNARTRKGKRKTVGIKRK